MANNLTRSSVRDRERRTKLSESLVRVKFVIGDASNATADMVT